MNYSVGVAYQLAHLPGCTCHDRIPIMNAPNEEVAKARAFMHVRSTVRGLTGIVTARDVRPLNCQGCGE